MQVKHALPRIRAGVDDEAIAAWRQAFLLRDVTRRPQQSAQHGLVACLRFRHRGEMTIRQNQDVRGGLRMNILKSNQIFFF